MIPYDFRCRATAGPKDMHYCTFLLGSRLKMWLPNCSRTPDQARPWLVLYLSLTEEVLNLRHHRLHAPIAKRHRKVGNTHGCLSYPSDNVGQYGFGGIPRLKHALKELHVVREANVAN